MLRYLLLYSGIILTLNLAAQAAPERFEFGQVHTLKSAILAEDRILNIYLPEGYQPDSAETYPVLYVLDGSTGEDFAHLAGLVDYMSLYHLLPPTIVIGIANVDRQRDFTYPSQDTLDLKYLPTHGGSARFIEFLDKEVFIYVKQHFNVNGKRGIIGQSLGGLLATEILFKRPELFDDYFIVSPSLWWDELRMIKQADRFLVNFPNKPKRVYLSVGREHPTMNQVADLLSEAIQQLDRPSLQFLYRPNLTENHATIQHTAIYDAFKSFYRADKTLKIAFGSCAHQTHPLPIFDEISKQAPDLFLFLGDNIYGDTKDMNVLRNKYQQLAEKPTFQRLKKNVPIMATWDDHDFGWNDAGRHYPFKEEAKEILLDFFDEPANSDRRNRPGIYTSEIIEIAGKKVQVILLDTRTFRDDLLINQQKEHPDRRYFYHLDYSPHSAPDSTLLGETQWAWLGQQLTLKADVRIIASSTQFGIEYNGYEAWANFPHEQQRMLNLIKTTKAEGVLFVSGDVHYAEISRIEVPGLYPIYDVTSSGLSSTWHFATPNANRIEGPIMDNHFGLLTIDFTGEISIKMEIWDVSGNQRIEHSIGLDELRFTE